MNFMWTLLEMDMGLRLSPAKDVAPNAKVICTFIFWVLLFYILVLPDSHADSTKPLKICVDIDGLNSENKMPSEEKLFSGPRVRIVLEAFRQIGINVTLINDGPWKRCLRDVELGYVDFALGAYYDDERAKIFDYSDHYNTFSPSIFFLASKSLKVASADDLKKLHGCGIYGYSYSHYGLGPADLDLTLDYVSVYRKLISGRCDYFLEELEAVVNGSNDIDFLHDPLISHSVANWAKPPASYLVTKKNGPNGAVLKEFNRGLQNIIQTGVAARIWSDGMGEFPYKP